MYHSELCGFYKLEAFKMTSGGVEHSRRVVADWFPNLIVNSGLDSFGSGSTPIVGYCYVGSGSSAPTNGDTNMGSHIAATSSITVNDYGIMGASPYYRWTKLTFRFDEGAAEGNLSEVGCGWNSNPSGALFSRALILDSGGSATTITVLSDEYLDVTYELRAYPLETDVTGTTTFTGNIAGSYAWTLRPAVLAVGMYKYQPGYNYVRHAINAGSDEWGSVSGTGRYVYAYTGAIGNNLNEPTGVINYGDTAWATYSNGTYYRDVTYTFGLTQGNHDDGIKSLRFPIHSFLMQMEFDPVIAKTSDDIVDLTFRFSWSRRP